jgi:hypothetical protein
MELLILAMRERIASSSIEFIDHIEIVSERDGRPGKDFVKGYLESGLDRLYDVSEGKKGRVKLSFCLSRRYDLVVIASFEGKALKVVTYYNYLKKPFR